MNLCSPIAGGFVFFPFIFGAFWFCSWMNHTMNASSVESERFWVFNTQNTNNTNHIEWQPEKWKNKKKTYILYMWCQSSYSKFLTEREIGVVSPQECYRQKHQTSTHFSNTSAAPIFRKSHILPIPSSWNRSVYGFDMILVRSQGM